MTLSTDDIVAINTLYARYNHAIDHGRHDEFAATFTAEGSLDAAGSQTVGQEALVGFSEGVQAGMPGIRHLVTNILLDGGGDTASGAAYLSVNIPGEEGRVVILTGVYEDQLSRVDGSWLFVSRKLNPDT
jgi:hypothetical protein